MNTVYADIREISPQEETDILVKNALAEIRGARQRNDHLFDKNGRISHRITKESIMAATRNYVRTEWKYWLMAIVGLLMWAMANAAVSAPVTKHTVDGVKFVQDKKIGKWFTIYKGKSNTLDEGFKDVRIMWKGKLKGEPLIMIAGNQGKECEMSFRLLWFKKDGNSEMVRDFPYCWGQNVQVYPGHPVTRVNVDGQEGLIDWEDGPRSGERMEELIKTMTDSSPDVEEQADLAEETEKQ